MYVYACVGMCQTVRGYIMFSFLPHQFIIMVVVKYFYSIAQAFILSAFQIFLKYLKHNTFKVCVIIISVTRPPCKYGHPGSIPYSFHNTKVVEITPTNSDYFTIQVTFTKDNLNSEVSR